MADVKWNGDNVRRRLEKAARLGINKTMSQCIAIAKASHPFQNRTGTAERSIRVVVKAITSADGKTLGIWGSMGVGYFRFLEFGTRFMKSNFATLRPTAEKVYPLLQSNIRDGWRMAK